MKYKSTNVVDLWKHFSNVYCAGSIDTYGARAENIRKDTVWSEIEDNMRLIKSKAPKVWIGISPTIQIMNAYTICDLNEQWINNGWINRWTMYWNILSNPSFYNVQHLPDHMKEELIEIWTKHLKWLHIKKDSPVHHTVNAAINWMRNGKHNPEELRQMCQHTKRLDKLRNEDTRAVFPELNYIWENYWE